MARRVVTPQPDELVKIGKEMVEFVKDPKNKVLHLREFYTLKKQFTHAQWRKIVEFEEIRTYYEQALAIVARKYIDGTINSSIAQRFLRLYFADLRESEDEKTMFEYQLKAQADLAVMERYEPAMMAMLSQIKKRQDSLNALEIIPNKDA